MTKNELKYSKTMRSLTMDKNNYKNSLDLSTSMNNKSDSFYNSDYYCKDCYVNKEAIDNAFHKNRK